MRWAGVGYSAYTTAFNELIEEGFLKQTEAGKFIFYDRSQIENERKEIINAETNDKWLAFTLEQ